MNYDPLKKPKFNEHPDYSHQFCRGLVGWWLLNEPGGNTAHDLSPGGLNPGTLTNGPTWKGGALDFDGSNDYVEISHSSSLDTPTGITLMLWIKPDVQALVDAYLLTKASVFHFHHTRSWTQNTYCYIWDNTATYSYVDFGQLGTGNWKHLAVVYPNSSNKISGYLNGAYYGQSPDALNGTVQTNSNYVNIAALSRDVEFGGYISEVSIYNRALIAAEVNALYVNSLSGEYAEFPKPRVYFLPPVAGAIAPTSVLYGPLVGPLSGPI